MHKNATKCNETLSKWCKNKHGASKIIDTFETYQALQMRPVQYGWMYPVERRLGYLKSTVRSKSRPEGSIAEEYILDECLHHCSKFLGDVIETRHNKPKRN
jgi:hypothetical protein